MPSTSPVHDMPFHPHRSPVYAAGGMVATSQPAAVLAGLDTLRKGGNAADAAIAAAAALAVTEPTGCGLGGDCFALYHDARSRTVLALNGSGRAPAGLSLDLLERQGLTALPPLHAHTVTVPGTVAGWCDLAARAGSRPMAELLAPAIELAREGFAVAPKTAYFWRRAVGSQLRGPDHPLLVHDRAPRAGELFRNPDLASTLERVAEHGADGFYQGPVAEAVAAAVHQHGGTMTVEDLAAHRSTWHESISTVFDEVRVHECPPNGQGLTALLALTILRELGTSGGLGAAGSAERLHLVIEALRLAFADSRRYIADPEFSKVPVAELLSPGYARERAGLIDRSRASVDVEAGRPHAHSDTVYLSVVDGHGNACSFIQSNYMGVGTGIAPRGTGFTLQNRGHNFSLDPDHANALAPGKRPYHTIIPALSTFADDSLHASFGVMGGFMQPQGHVQVLLAMVVDGMDAQAALDAPRVCVGPGGEVAGHVAGNVAIEDGVDEAVCEELADMGHAVRVVRGHERALFGRGQIILRDMRDGDSGVLCGGSDLRADGCALGF